MEYMGKIFSLILVSISGMVPFLGKASEEIVSKNADNVKLAEFPEIELEQIELEIEDIRSISNKKSERPSGDTDW